MNKQEEKDNQSIIIEQIDRGMGFSPFFEQLKNPEKVLFIDSKMDSFPASPLKFESFEKHKTTQRSYNPIVIGQMGKGKCFRIKEKDKEREDFMSLVDLELDIDDYGPSMGKDWGCSLRDPNGIYLGKTNKGGKFIFNPFCTTSNRFSSHNGLVLGGTATGKTTFIKMIMEKAFSEGHYIRGLDVRGEYSKDIQSLGGTIVDLSDANSIADLKTSPDAMKRLEDEPIVFFYIPLDMCNSIFKQQISFALSLVQDHIRKYSWKQDVLCKQGKIKHGKAKGSLVIMDECHCIINQENMSCIEQLHSMLREMRRFGSGLWLSAQSWRYSIMCQNGNYEYDQMVNSLLEYIQYKVTCIKQGEVALHISHGEDYLIKLDPQYLRR